MNGSRTCSNAEAGEKIDVDSGSHSASALLRQSNSFRSASRRRVTQRKAGRRGRRQPGYDSHDAEVERPSFGWLAVGTGLVLAGPVCRSGTQAAFPGHAMMPARRDSTKGERYRMGSIVGLSHPGRTTELRVYTGIANRIGSISSRVPPSDSAAIVPTEISSSSETSTRPTTRTCRNSVWPELRGLPGTSFPWLMMAAP